MRRPCHTDTLLASLGLLFLLAGAASCLAPEVRAQTPPPPVVVHAADYGVTADSARDNTPALQAAFDAARAGREPGQIAWVELPAGVIGYEGILAVTADSLGLRGCGGAVLTRDTTDAESPTGGGEVYHPVRRADTVDPSACVSRLRVRDGAMSRALPGRSHPIVRITLLPAPRGKLSTFWLEDVVLDGNLAGNLPALLSIAPEDRKRILQDSPSHTGINASSHDGLNWCGPRGTVNALLTVRRAEVTGYAATGLLGDVCSRWSLDTVRLAGPTWNHVAYKADGGGNTTPDGAPLPTPGGALGAWGGWADVTLAGPAWSHVVSQRGLRVERLVYEDYAPNPLPRETHGLIGVRAHTARVAGLAVQARTQTQRGAPYADLFNLNGGVGLLVPGAAPPAEKVALPPVLTPEPPAEPDPPRFVRQVVTFVGCRDTALGTWVPPARCDAQDARTP